MLTLNTPQSLANRWRGQPKILWKGLMVAVLQGHKDSLPSATRWVGKARIRTFLPGKSWGQIGSLRAWGRPRTRAWYLPRWRRGLATRLAPQARAPIENSCKLTLEWMPKGSHRQERLQTNLYNSNISTGRAYYSREKFWPVITTALGRSRGLGRTGYTSGRFQSWHRESVHGRSKFPQACTGRKTRTP